MTSEAVPHKTAIAVFCPQSEGIRNVAGAAKRMEDFDRRGKGVFDSIRSEGRAVSKKRAVEV